MVLFGATGDLARRKLPTGLAAAVHAAEAQLGPDVRRLHYLSVPPEAALAVIDTIREAGLVERSRVVMEKPFGTDLASAIALNDRVFLSFYGKRPGPGMRLQKLSSSSPPTRPPTPVGSSRPTSD